MGTRTRLFIGWQGQDDVSAVLTRLLGEAIALPGEDISADSRARHDALAASLNERLRGLAAPVSLSFVGNTDHYDNTIAGAWTLSCDGFSLGSWVGGRDGLVGEPVDVGVLKAASAAAKELARAKKLRLPSLRQLTVS